jgi:tetratricopeptide (TPR) repeat protein
MKRSGDVDLKQFAEVNRSCSVLIARGKPSAAVYELRALARAELRDFPGAIDDLTYAIALRPDQAALLSRRGWLYIIAAAPRLARHDFEAAILLDSSGADAFNGRGAARLGSGEYRQAVADADKALSLGKPAPKLFVDAARVYALAADVVAEVSKSGREGLSLRAQYQDRAATLIVEAVKQMPEAERAGFLRNVIEIDQPLRAIRRRIRSQELSSAAGSPNPSLSKPAQ